MLILVDTTGTTIKTRVDDENHVRIGIFQTAVWIDGVRRNIRDNRKPHCELTISDCADLYRELVYMGHAVFQGS